MTQTATTITVDSLPIANSIDPVQDRLLIYTLSATDIQGISRNVLLGLSSQPVGINDSQTLTTKILDNTNSLTIKAANLVIQDGTDTTKQVKFIASGITTGNTRSYTLPDYNATLATLAGVETLTNKTLTAPVTTAISNTGGLTTNALSVTAGITVGTTLAVTGATTLSGSLTVAGATTLSGAVTLTTNNSITAANLATNAIELGYTAITSSIGPTATSTSDVDVAGLTVTVTVPAGGRDIQIMASGGDYEQSGGIGTVYGVPKIKEGSTVLNTSSVAPSAANIPNGWNVWAKVTAPSAGSHTYKIAFAQNSTGPTYILGASATNPMQILVKAI